MLAIKRSIGATTVIFIYAGCSIGRGVIPYSYHSSVPVAELIASSNLHNLHIPDAFSLKVDRYHCGCSFVSIKTNSCDPLFLIFVKFSFCTQVLPMRMLDFLDAPVPFLVSFSVLFLGVNKKNSTGQSFYFLLRMIELKNIDA